MLPASPQFHHGLKNVSSAHQEGVAVLSLEVETGSPGHGLQGVFGDMELDIDLLGETLRYAPQERPSPASQMYTASAPSMSLML